jgi:hypothetical protein
LRQKEKLKKMKKEIEKKRERTSEEKRLLKE